jgi:hypothetical protein
LDGFLGAAIRLAGLDIADPASCDLESVRIDQADVVARRWLAYTVHAADLA